MTRHPASVPHARAAAMTGGTTLVESMHGAGSPQAQRIMIYRESDLQKKMSLAKSLLGIHQKKKASQGKKAH